MRIRRWKRRWRREKRRTRNPYDWLLGMLGKQSHEELTPHNEESDTLKEESNPETETETEINLDEPTSTSEERLSRQQARLLEIWRGPKWAFLDFWPLCLADGIEQPEYDGTGAWLLREWLERSKEVPLTVVCRRERERPSCAYWNRYTASLFGVLAQQAHRWRHVDMFVPFPSTGLLNDELAPYEEGEVSEPGVMLEMLETASLCAIGPNGEKGPDSYFLQNARNLRKLHLCHFYEFRVPEASYTRLNELRINFARTNHVLRWLEKTPSLRVLSMQDVYDTATMENLQDIEIELESLCMLTLLACPSSLLDGLYLTPALEYFKYIQMPQEKLDIYSIFCFLRRSACALKTLYLEAQIIHGPSLNQLLPHLRTLRKFTLRWSSDEDAGGVATGLARILNLDFEINAPFLQHFEFHARGGPFYGILNVVKQRWARGHFIDDDEVERLTGLSGANFVAKVRFVGFASESEECMQVTREYVKEEMDQGMEVKFASWKDIEMEDEARKSYG